MIKFFIILILWSTFMNETFAKEYFFSNNLKKLPEQIKVDDKNIQNDFFSYFKNENLFKKFHRIDEFYPVVEAKIKVVQIDSFRLKLNVFLKNNKRNWYIPRFEEKSVYSERKIYLIGDGNKIISTYPQWWSKKSIAHNAPSIYIPKKEYIGQFSKFNKNDTYNIEYIVDIPSIEVENISFEIYFLDDSTPPEISNRYSNLNESNLYIVETKSNIVKVKCKKISQNKLDGYICDIQ